MLRTFSDEVLKVAPHATAPGGHDAVDLHDPGRFVQAAITAFVLIFVILSVPCASPGTWR